MSVIDLSTSIGASPEICFDLARDIDLHVKSMPGSNERAVGGVMSGLIGPGQEVTWEATHLGVRQRLTSRITAFDRPRHFRDSLVSGPFTRFDHDHFFVQEGSATIMRDVFDYESPFGWLGRCADGLFLRSYLVKLLKRRAHFLKAAAEGTR